MSNTYELTDAVIRATVAATPEHIADAHVTAAWLEQDRRDTEALLPIQSRLTSEVA